MDVLSLSNSSSEQQSPSAAEVRQISAVIFPINVALETPHVKFNKVKAAPRKLTRKTRRTKRKSLSGEVDEGDENEFLFDGGSQGQGDVKANGGVTENERGRRDSSRQRVNERGKFEDRRVKGY
ncbi:hypothetical protein RND71_018546 [Anisodus tanguticus]|uniref:Uncharacterized protein n=1 Tax=Anisodus tanguticus TaxID=243964 RepID=A0AAE1S4M1_9SOLA|nr:hypothetical protein RND71_018546 [Anisodus tanguticus]